MNLFDVSAVLMIGFAVLSFVDGVYLHLFSFRLHARAESRREHLAHAARAVLFPPALVLVLSGTSSGWLLWLGLAVLALDAALTIADVRLEARSRTFQRGLPRYEERLHYVLTALHVGAVATSLLARPVEAFITTTSVHVADASFAHLVAVQGLLGGSVLVAAAHFALLHPWFSRRSAAVA